MLVAIAAAGTGTVPKKIIVAGTSVADAINTWVNTFIPPLDPADFVGVDTGWPGPGAEKPPVGDEWAIDRDTPALTTLPLPTVTEFDGTDTVTASGVADVQLPAAVTATKGQKVEYKNGTPNLKISRSGGDTINGNAADLTGLPDGAYEAVPDGQDNWYVRALATRSFDAVVRPDGSGDYTSISGALAAGARSVFITSGTYVETGSLTLPEDAALFGESPGSVLVVLAAGQSISFSGAARRIATGTITVTNGSAAVTGSGTSFLSVQPQDFLKIGSAYHKIISVTDDENLTLETVYRGASYSGSFAAQSMATGAYIANLIIANGTSHGICLEQAFHVAIQNTLIFACGLGGADASFIAKECSEVHCIGFVVENSGADGVRVENSTLIRLETNAIKNCVGHGFSVATSDDISIDAAMALQNGGCGLDIESSAVRVSLSECIVNRNASHGVSLGEDSNVEGGSFFANGGDGIVVPIVSNAMIGDARCSGNGGSGVNVQAGATNTMVTSCNLLGNTGTNLVDNGTSTTAASNKS